MTTRNEKLQSILESRNACLSALISKGSAITSATPFSEYAAAIRAIEGGGGGGTLDNADMVYAGNVAYICMKVTGGTVDIDWGDGTSETIQSSSSEQFLAHNYSTLGLYGVNLTLSSDASISFGDYMYTSSGDDNGEKSVLVIVNSMPVGETTDIGTFTFAECSSLASIRLPDGLASIGAYVFYNCSSLAGISLPAGVTDIGEGALYNCSSLAGISLPAGVTDIGRYAFGHCDAMKTIYSKALTPPKLTASSSLPGTSYVENIYVPVGCADAYKSATNWSSYADVISEMNVEDMP